MNFRTFYFVLLFTVTMVIVVRRFVWGLIPSQVPAPLVHLTLAVSCCWLVLQVVRWARPVEPTKMDKVKPLLRIFSHKALDLTRVLASPFKELLIAGLTGEN